ncbi:hypothetical protein [Synechococcus elongatus]|uniref:Uncharacterized protein n=1 Tax=Synechococcus elongatus PCC 11802 TaxID=2283154 RepID=A0AAT9K8L4_SYNEL|nr:hypothetical protein [Synechococcus elongatus]QFZ91637.1 hypothetical protein EKO22_03915 [Synechococcus elongatus PCC 11802]
MPRPLTRQQIIQRDLRLIRRRLQRLLAAFPRATQQFLSRVVAVGNVRSDREVDQLVDQVRTNLNQGISQALDAEEPESR